MNIANNCEIFEYICWTAETVFEVGREAFEKEENSSLVSKIHIEACWSCLNKERRTDAATEIVKDGEVSSNNTFIYIDVILGIVRKRRLTAEGPERASTTCSRSLRRGGDLKRYEIQRHRHRKETGSEVRRRYVLVKETTQQNRNSVKKVQYSATDIVENV